MREAKTFASLSSGLLARKGAAKPAMRPQGFGQMGVSLEDLGWDDMGHNAAPTEQYHDEAPRERVSSPITALTPVGRSVSEEAQAEEVPAAPPLVVEQQRSIEARFADPAVPREAEPAVEKPSKGGEVVAMPPRSRARTGKAKAAFTLRLEEERHLKLRLACAVSRRSAQQIVTEALDAFLASLPELDRLADQVPAGIAKRN